MAPFDPNEMVGTLMGGVAKFGESVEIIRSPIEVGNKVIIPAVVARLGVGAGGGSGKRPGSNEEGSGGGGGGGMTLTPVFLVVDAQGERLVTVPNSLASASDILDTVKVAAGKIFGKKKKGESAESESE